MTRAQPSLKGECGAYADDVLGYPLNCGCLVEPLVDGGAPQTCTAPDPAKAAWNPNRLNDGGT